MKKYKVISDTSLKKFEELVNEAMADGWEPLGGVSSSQAYIGYSYMYCQALIKQEWDSFSFNPDEMETPAE